LERLAPLTAPRFPTRTPQTKAETDIALKTQAETMKKLRICDLDVSEDESDAGDVEQARLFLTRDDEQATHISPGGHVTKRRIRSRPTSSEMLQDSGDSPFFVKVWCQS
jgi:mitosis inhibitor protein kinase SWE1